MKQVVDQVVPENILEATEKIEVELNTEVIKRKKIVKKA
jgi:hypothetical protein